MTLTTTIKIVQTDLTKITQIKQQKKIGSHPLSPTPFLKKAAFSRNSLSITFYFHLTFRYEINENGPCIT